MNSPAFRPIGLRYLVLPDPIEGESETIGEITLSTPKDPHKQSVEGTVVAKGKSCAELEIGDKVVYGKYSGYDHNLDGVDYKVLQENELLGEHIRTPFDDRCLQCGRPRMNAEDVAEPCWKHIPVVHMDMPSGESIPVEAFPMSNEPTHIITITEAHSPAATHVASDDDIPW